MRGFQEVSDYLEVHYIKKLLWMNRNCLIKIFENKEKSCFKNTSLNVFKEIIKYA
jgi:hypothetical protein